MRPNPKNDFRVYVDENLSIFFLFAFFAYFAV